jgi:DNA-directed RNA polymerase subunit RPC12/RpoP
MSWWRNLVAVVDAMRAEERRKLAIEAAQRAKEEEQRRGTIECPCGYRLIWKRVVESGATHCLCGRELPSITIQGGKAA